MIQDKNIIIKNIYYMLSYAFQILNEEGYKKVETESFENVADLCASILSHGVSVQIKRGLIKEYHEIEDEVTCIKGKINLAETIKQQSLIKKKIVCDFDDFNENTYLNRIIKTTMMLLLKSDAKTSRKKELKKNLVYFENVDLIPVNDINWKFQFNRNNQTYRMLTAICYLVIKGLLQTTTDGKTKLMSFFDEQRMCRLYEKFILEYYKKEHPEYHASASKIEWQLDNDFDFMLPEMKTDITLSFNDSILIIDAKYYEHSLQSYFDVSTVNSANIYQMFTYVKNKQVENEKKKVSGIILYAKTDEVTYPNVSYSMSGNKISARTLDLNSDFEDIRKRLDFIAESEFLN